METTITISTLCDGCGDLVPMEFILADWQQWQAIPFDESALEVARELFPYLSDQECRTLVEFLCVKCLDF